MRIMSVKRILKYCLIFLTVGFSFLAWNAVDRAINVENASLWIGPIIFFSLTFIFLSLTIVLVQGAADIYSTAFLIIFLSVIFTPKILHVALLLLSFGFLSIAVGKIRADLRLNIKVDFYKSIRAGSTFVILAFSLAIASHYFFETKNTRLENIIPKFDMSRAINSIAPKIISTVNPEFKNISQENLTVDQWILKNEGGEIENAEKISPLLAATSKEIILSEGRSQLENFAGFEITGREKLADVLTRMVSNKINNFIAPDYSDRKIPIFPLIVSSAIFLTMFSLGSFLRPLWTWIADFIFWILKKIKLVKILEKMEKVEVIE